MLREISAARGARRNFSSVAAAVAGVAYALPAQANSPNVLPILLTIFVLVPVLLLVPPIMIARHKQPGVRRRPWVLASIALLLFSFGSLFLALTDYKMAVGDGWVLAYLWPLPGFLLLVAFKWRAAKTPLPPTIAELAKQSQVNGDTR